MATVLDHRSGAPSTTDALARFVAKHAVTIYVALTFAISWTGSVLLLGPSAFPLTWARFERLGGQLYATILAGPAVAGLVMTGLVHGRAGLRDLFRSLRKWRVGARAYALALSPALALAAVPSLLALVWPRFTPAIVTADDKASLLVLGLAASLAFGIFEELGWTGFAVPELRKHHGPVTTGLVVGVVWGVWHFPLFWAADSFSAPLPLALLLGRLLGWLPGFRILMVRIHDRTGSLLLPVLMHVSLDMTTLVFMPRALSGPALVLYTVATVWILVGVTSAAAATRRARGGRPR